MSKKIKEKNQVFYIAIVLFIVSCSGNLNTRPQPESDVKLLSLSEQWKLDSLGCLKIRTKALAESILDSFTSKEISENAFLNLFGNPNRRINIDDRIILEYYFGSLCFGGNRIDSVDYCVAEFTFRNHYLLNTSFICI